MSFVKEALAEGREREIKEVKRHTEMTAYHRVDMLFHRIMQLNMNDTIKLELFRQELKKLRENI